MGILLLGLNVAEKYKSLMAQKASPDEQFVTVGQLKEFRIELEDRIDELIQSHRGWRDDFDRKINTLVEGQHQIHIKITTIAAYQDGLNASQRAPADQI